MYTAKVRIAPVEGDGQCSSSRGMHPSESPRSTWRASEFVGRLVFIGTQPCYCKPTWMQSADSIACRVLKGQSMPFGTLMDNKQTSICGLEVH
jgi:hypothetical protein